MPATKRSAMPGIAVADLTRMQNADGLGSLKVRLQLSPVEQTDL